MCSPPADRSIRAHGCAERRAYGALRLIDLTANRSKSARQAKMLDLVNLGQQDKPQ
jgi:hypothetical protein